MENIEEQLELALSRQESFSDFLANFSKKIISKKTRNNYKKLIINFLKENKDIIIDDSDSDLEEFLNNLEKGFSQDLLIGFLEKKGVSFDDENFKEKVMHELVYNNYYYKSIFDKKLIIDFLKNKKLINSDNTFNQEETNLLLDKIQHELNNVIEVAKKQQEVGSETRGDNFLNLREEDILAFFILGTIYNSKDDRLVKKGFNTDYQNNTTGEGKTAVLFGDTHAQLVDLFEQLQGLGLFNIKEKNSDEPLIVFLGDYIDRGKYSLETLMLITLLKIKNPERVVMLRGNHEKSISDIKLKNHIYNPILEDKDNFLKNFSEKIKDEKFYFYIKDLEKKIENIYIVKVKKQEDFKNFIKKLIKDPEFIISCFETEFNIESLREKVEEKFSKKIDDQEFEILEDFINLLKSSNFIKIISEDKGNFLENFSDKITNRELSRCIRELERNISKIFSRTEVEKQEDFKKSIKKLIKDPEFIISCFETEFNIESLREKVEEKFSKKIDDQEFEILKESIRLLKTSSYIENITSEYIIHKNVENFISNVFFENLPISAKINDHFISHGGIGPELMNKKTAIFSALQHAVIASKFSDFRIALDGTPMSFSIDNNSESIKNLVEYLVNKIVLLDPKTLLGKRFLFSKKKKDSDFDNSVLLDELPEFNEFIENLIELFSNDCIEYPYTIKLPDEQELIFNEEDIVKLREEFRKFCNIEELANFIKEDNPELPIDILNYLKGPLNTEIGIVANILWNDPDFNIEFFDTNTKRGDFFVYGKKAYRIFLEQNKLKQIEHGHTHQSHYIDHESEKNLREYGLLTLVTENSHGGTELFSSVCAIIPASGDKILSTYHVRGKPIEIQSIIKNRDEKITIIDKNEGLYTTEDIEQNPETQRTIADLGNNKPTPRAEDMLDYDLNIRSILEDPKNISFKMIFDFVAKNLKIHEKASNIENKEAKEFLIKTFYSLSYEEISEFCKEIDDLDSDDLKNITLDQIRSFKEIAQESVVSRILLPDMEMEFVELTPQNPQLKTSFEYDELKVEEVPTTHEEERVVERHVSFVERLLQDRSEKTLSDERSLEFK